MKTLLFIIIFLTILCLTPVAFAEDSGLINVSVQVLPHKITDTINDFDFAKMNSNDNAGIQGQVAGATSTIPEPAAHSEHWDSFVSKIIGFFKSIL